MRTRSSCSRFSLLGVTTLIVAIILCMGVQSEALAQSDQSVQGKAVVTSTQNAPSSEIRSLDEKALINNIGTLMDDKLAPLFRMQGNLEKLILEDKFSGPKMTDIVGGIGWILGLGGITAFFWSFKRKPRD